MSSVVKGPTQRVGTPFRQMPRSTNGAIETAAIKQIVKSLKEGNTSKFKDKFGYDIQDARERSGNRGKHFDFEIKVNGDWKKVEHKGSEFNRAVNPERPWEVGVQFANLGCEKFELVKGYALKWYTMLVGSGILKQKFSLKSEIPLFDEWWKDCKSQGEPKTDFSKELKKKGLKLKEERRLVNAAFKVCQCCLNKFAAEILEIANQVLEQKDYWLVNGEWFPKFQLPPFLRVEMNTTDFTDVVFSFACEGLELKPRLRWGGHQGCANLRLDLK